MDSHTFMILKKMASAITILGALPVIVGVQAGVASSLVDLGMDFGKILTVVTTEDALEIVRSRSI
jgi:anti-anti-sigma regulatory factor